MDLNLIQYISEFTDLKTCLQIVRMCKWTSRNIKIKYVNDEDLRCKITDHILEQKRYSFVIELNVNNNQKVRKISQLCNLQKLYIDWNCGVTNDEIKNLNLIELYAHANSKINKIKHMTNLQKLCIGWNSGVNDAEIKELNLIKLDARDNPKISKISHMTGSFTSLQILNVDFNCGVTDYEIKDLNLVRLIAYGNPKIKRSTLYKFNKKY